ncbi:glutathione-disulfide reductase [Coleofasciculus sp.]|uniref:glutathione-disulfide reductase n=1 Tax=Coleofasciculus sp. TaxID=3100458 RepID=UPI003A2545AA
MSYNYELLIIGAGSGGLAAAKRAAAYDINVAVVEKESLGGTCVNRGCIPKKLMVYAADFALQDKLATSYGWSECQRQINWSQFLSKVHHHIDKLNQSYLQTLEKAGIDLIRGQAKFVDAHTITVNDRQITANKIIIAVGGHPIVPNIPGKEHGITSREMFHLQDLPKRLAIIGGGYIGVEFASMMDALGSEVTLMDVEESILPGFDQDIRLSVQRGLSQRGIRILTQTTAKEITKGSDGIQLSLSGDYQETLNADTVLIATSRAPNTKDLGLENTEVNVSEKGVIEVDEYSRTTQDTIFAIGDCTNRIPLTPVAIAEGKAVVGTAIGNQPQSVNYDYVPSAVFTRPEAATVGMTQSKAREKFGDSVRCYHTEFKPMLYSLSEQDEKAMIKLIVEGENQRIVGAQMVGEHAADIIQTLAVAIRQGVNKQQLNETICIHPTIGEEVLTLE